MTYPREALVFENKYDGSRVKRGAHVEIVEWNRREGRIVNSAMTRGEVGGRWAGVRILDERYAIACSRHPRQKWPGAVLQLRDLKPLTAAARAFLKMAK